MTNDEERVADMAALFGWTIVKDGDAYVVCDEDGPLKRHA